MRRLLLSWIGHLGNNLIQSFKEPRATLGACPRNADSESHAVTLRVARNLDNSSGVDRRFGHVAQGAFSEANLTENHAPDRRGNATVAY